MQVQLSQEQINFILTLANFAETMCQYGSTATARESNQRLREQAADLRLTLALAMAQK